MENCLVTKLRTAVDNDNLPILGAFDFMIPCNGSFKEIKRVYCEARKITFETINGHFTNSAGDDLGTSFYGNTIGEATDIKGVIGDGTVILRVHDNYDIKAIDLRYMTTIITDLDFLYCRKSITSIVLYYQGGGLVFPSRGDLTKIKPDSVLSNFSFQELNAGDVIGNMAELPLFRNAYISQTSVSGTLEDYLKANKDLIWSEGYGETKTTQLITGLPKNVTFNGAKFTSNVVCTLVSVENSIYTFTVYCNGVTTTATYNASTDTWTYA